MHPENSSCQRLGRLARVLLFSLCCLGCITPAAWAVPLSILGQADEPAATSAAVVAPESLEQQIGLWIDQLGDPSFIKRQLAKAELEKTGLLAFEQLRLASSHPNIEIASNAQYLLDSMRVVWTLTTDSFEVQRLLKDYNDFQPNQRMVRMQRLASLRRLDAYRALLRLMRYENNEDLSKCAALYVMDAILEEPTTPAILWPELIRTSIGESKRTSALWLNQLLQVIEHQSTDFNAWLKFTQAERKLLESNSDKTSESTVKRLVRWTAKWLTTTGRREEAVAFLQPSLELLGTNPASSMDDVAWLLEVGLPEAVIQLAQQKPELFSKRPRNRYLLAEAYLKQGDAPTAQRMAGEARDLVRSLPIAPRIDGKLDGEARQRLDTARGLTLRGMFDWAEQEMIRAAALRRSPGDLSNSAELDVRYALASFYWEANQPALAAATWLPILKRSGLLLEDGSYNPKPTQGDKDLLKVMSEEEDASEGQPFTTYAPAHYFFYLGLAKINEGNWAQARQELRQAIELFGFNPDFMIALLKASQGDAATETELNRAIAKLEIHYRERLVAKEAELTGATSRTERLRCEWDIASYCNQLAWLLAGTHRKPREAIALSERSLALREEESVYLDTLARCYFSAGETDKAIEIQSRAVRQTPYERQMVRQLDEFRAAKSSTPNR